MNEPRPPLAQFARARNSAGIVLMKQANLDRGEGDETPKKKVWNSMALVHSCRSGLHRWHRPALSGDARQ
jgi:hypothetical protein